MADFQRQVYTVPSMAVAGDFASHNPRQVVLAGPGGLVAGSSGVTVGRFAWATFPKDQDGSPAIVSNAGFGPPTGFVHREQQGLITTFLADASMVVPQGFPVVLHSAGDFWVNNDGTTQAQMGYKAFANLLTGKVQFAAAGTNVGGASATGSSIANTTLTLVGSISDNILTVTSVSAGSVYPGATLTSNGLGQVVSQLTGTPNAAGTYLLSVGEQTVAAGTTIGGNYGVLTTGTNTGTFAVGMVLSGSGVAANTVITQLITGAGGSGSTSVVNNNTVVGSTTITGNTAIETKYIAMSVGLQNELVKISSQALG